MSESKQLAEAIALRDTGRLADAVNLFQSLAEIGNTEAQTHLATLMLQGLHRFATEDEYSDWCDAATKEASAKFFRELKDDIEQAMIWLENASASGIGPASHNLAMAYLEGHGNIPDDARRHKVKTLLAKAREQGFAFFGNPEGEEQYLQTLEHYAAGEGGRMPWEP